MVKKQNSMQNLESKIMETKPLQEDLTEFYGMDYQVVQKKKER